MESFNNRLLKALMINNMSQAELARRSGVDKGSISRYLQGKFSPKQGAVYSMARVLGVSPAWLIGEDVPMKPTNPDNILNASSELTVIIEQLSPADKETLKAIAETLLNKAKKEAQDD